MVFAMRAQKASALVDRKSLLTDVMYLLYGQLAIPGAKFANKRLFRKGRHRGLTGLKRAFLACPKIIAAIFLQAFEGTFTLYAIAVFFPNSGATRDLPKII